jgi:hypothetical protein
MIKKASLTKETVRVAAFVLILCGSSCNGKSDPDAFYAGGPDDYAGKSAMSETWTIRELLPDAPHSSINGKKFTLTRTDVGVWSLVAEPGLNWNPSTIPLKDHMAWVSSNPGTDQWRWESAAPTTIDGHDHTVCVGFTVLGAEPRRDDDRIRIAIVNVGEQCLPPPNTGDEHPGHADAGR